MPHTLSHAVSHAVSHLPLRTCAAVLLAALPLAALPIAALADTKGKPMTQTHAEAKAPAAPALSAFLPAGYAEVSRRAVAVDGVPAELVRQSMRRSACTAG